MTITDTNVLLRAVRPDEGQSDTAPGGVVFRCYRNQTHTAHRRRNFGETIIGTAKK